MAFPYNMKVVVSGKQVEVYKYTKSVWRDFERTRKQAYKLNRKRAKAIGHI
jgi:hypothetical protein